MHFWTCLEQQKSFPYIFFPWNTWTAYVEAPEQLPLLPISKSGPEKLWSWQRQATEYLDATFHQIQWHDGRMCGPTAQDTTKAAQRKVFIRSERTTVLLQVHWNHPQRMHIIHAVIVYITCSKNHSKFHRLSTNIAKYTDIYSLTLKTRNKLL